MTGEKMCRNIFQQTAVNKWTILSKRPDFSTVPGGNAKISAEYSDGDVSRSIAAEQVAFSDGVVVVISD